MKEYMSQSLPNVCLRKDYLINPRKSRVAPHGFMLIEMMIVVAATYTLTATGINGCTLFLDNVNNKKASGDPCGGL